MSEGPPHNEPKTLEQLESERRAVAVQLEEITRISPDKEEIEDLQERLTNLDENIADKKTGLVDTPNYDHTDQPETIQELDLSHDERVEYALNCLHDEGLSMSRNEAAGFLRNLSARNENSRQAGEEKYYLPNVQAAIKQFNYAGEASTLYRKLGSFYTNPTADKVQKFAGTPATQKKSPELSEEIEIPPMDPDKTPEDYLNEMRANLGSSSK